ncbi:hypothetical protein [uncultured Jannaschia sp.]|uniref:hypothetical protein n=1 Tax=uncultured Jannaschia sp. TaxID=293347 RepID=UPI00261B92C1|nr:hypothetical protein [uncultured Jannaschia sp.]
MPETDNEIPSSITIPAGLGVAGVPDVHARLVSAVNAADPSGHLEIDLADGPVAPLALQLVVSAVRSVPADRLTLGPRAAAALTTLETFEED